MVPLEDERIGKLLVAIRRQAGLTQRALAERSEVPRRDIIRIEAGLVGSVTLDRTRRAFAAAGGRARLSTWWQGAAADRLLDERHAAILERAVDLFARRGWEPAVEVSFARYGERGSIDILAAQRAAGAIAVTEVKDSIGSLEEMNRVLDMKERLGPWIAEQRFGFRPRVVGRILILPNRDAIRRLVARHEQTMASVYPARSREVRRWLHDPVESLRGIWFVSDVHQRNPGTR